MEEGRGRAAYLFHILKSSAKPQSINLSATARPDIRETSDPWYDLKCTYLKRPEMGLPPDKYFRTCLPRQATTWQMCLFVLPFAV